MGILSFEEYEKLVSEDEDYKALSPKEQVATRLYNRLRENQNALAPYIYEWFRTDIAPDCEWGIFDAYSAFNQKQRELFEALEIYLKLDEE